MAVCWFHLAANGPARHTLLAHLGALGFLGVHVFFVISGFIVPYAMFTAGYTLKNAWTFLLKRMIRVEPPYMASIALFLLVSVPSALLRGDKPGVDPVRLALHLGYLIPFFPKYRWITDVYWSLAVEFQYYLAISLLFPLLTSRRQSIRIVSCVLFAASSLLATRNARFLPNFAPMFVFGFMGMLRTVGLASRKEFFFVVAICAILTNPFAIPYTATGVLTLTVIMTMRWMPGILLWLGDISYSLYLIHEMIGRRILPLGERLLPAGFLIGPPIAAVLVSILCALIMFRLVELPAKRMAARWKYNAGTHVARPLKLSQVR
jgi:peptidoglycan/LPS O-acetylase OafA/YrhL